MHCLSSFCIFLLDCISYFEPYSRERFLRRLVNMLVSLYSF